MFLPCDYTFVNVHCMKILGKMILLGQTTWDENAHSSFILLLYLHGCD